MNEETQDILLDLLTKKATCGLDEAEQRQLDDLDSETADLEFRSLEMAAAAISMIGLEEEPLPAHLSAKILANASQFVASNETLEMAAPWPPANDRVAAAYTSESESQSGSSWFGWFGWAAAAAACIALAVNIWFTRFQPTVDVAQDKPPANVEIPPVLTAAQLRDQLLRSATDTIKASWAAGNIKEIANQVIGDVVWSDEKQAGYMSLRGLPVNDKSKETYQLWIFDKTRDPKHPVDGGTFDVSATGEVVIPINAKLNAQRPDMFAITIEKPGGVVVSDQGKIAAIAKVETKPQPKT